MGLVFHTRRLQHGGISPGFRQQTHLPEATASEEFRLPACLCPVECSTNLPLDCSQSGWPFLCTPGPSHRETNGASRSPAPQTPWHLHCFPRLLPALQAAICSWCCCSYWQRRKPPQSLRPQSLRLSPPLSWQSPDLSQGEIAECLTLSLVVGGMGDTFPPRGHSCLHWPCWCPLLQCTQGCSSPTFHRPPTNAPLPAASRGAYL